MMEPFRLYIASPDAARLERAFAFDERFFTLGGSGEGETALREISRLLPDIAVVDGVLAGMDGTEAVKRLSRLVSPPRVLFLLRTGPWTGETAPDEICPYPCPEETLLSRARAAADRPLPGLSEPLAPKRLAVAEALLDRLNVPRRLKGRACMACAAAALSCSPRLGLSLAYGLYPYVAAQCHTTPRAAERAIRTAVESTWLGGDLNGIQSLFGFSVDAEKGKPTNAEFLFMLAEHVRLTLEKLMKEGLDIRPGFPL